MTNIIGVCRLKGSVKVASPDAPTTMTLRASVPQSVVSIEDVPPATSSATMLSVADEDPSMLMSAGMIPVLKVDIRRLFLDMYYM